MQQHNADSMCETKVELVDVGDLSAQPELKAYKAEFKRRKLPLATFGNVRKEETCRVFLVLHSPAPQERDF